MLDGPADNPDGRFHAFRKDLADVALAGRVVASHYAEPLKRTIARKTGLRGEPSPDGETLASLKAGDPFEMLENRVGWAWGYGGRERRVGYVESDALTC